MSERAYIKKQNVKSQKKRRRHKVLFKRCIGVICLLTMILGMLQLAKRVGMIKSGSWNNDFSLSEELNELEASLIRKRIDESDENADTLKMLLKNNPETIEFVREYKEKKNHPPAETIGEVNQGEIPLLLQWDKRWGYCSYGDNMIAVNGCGPTSVAMVAAGLTGDSAITPYKVAKMAEEQGYYEGDEGTSWLFMTEGVEQLGIHGEEMILSENVIVEALEQGKPIICSMRKGDFTLAGHFIVLTGMKDGKIKVNDPNSAIRSEKYWEYERLEPQINNLWGYTL